MTDNLSAMFGRFKSEPYYSERDVCGTTAAYAAGCRCPECREASRLARAAYRARARGEEPAPVARNHRGEWNRQDFHVIPEFQPAEWTEHALCRGIDTSAFFPEKGGQRWTPFITARDLCGRCPVADDCLLYALKNRERHGLWGGVPERQRRPLEHLTEEEAIAAGQQIRDAWAPKRRPA